jgi:hypothetical protein
MDVGGRSAGDSIAPPAGWGAAMSGPQSLRERFDRLWDWMDTGMSEAAKARFWQVYCAGASDCMTLIAEVKPRDEKTVVVELKGERAKAVLEELRAAAREQMAKPGSWS